MDKLFNKKSWSGVLIGPLFGLVVAPILSFPIIALGRKILWATGNHMSGKYFLAVVSIPTVASVYFILFVWFGAFFAPNRRSMVATGLYILGTCIAFTLLRHFPSSNIAATSSATLWQPLAVTVLAGTLGYIAFLLADVLFFKKEMRRG